MKPEDQAEIDAFVALRESITPTTKSAVMLAERLVQSYSDVVDKYEVRVNELLVYREALHAIARKSPHSVSREEAADMACEFKALAEGALKNGQNCRMSGENKDS